MADGPRRVRAGEQQVAEVEELEPEPQGAAERPSLRTKVEPGARARVAAEVSPGQELIAQRYRVVRSLGSGGQGHTFLAIDEESGTEVALKRFDLRAATDWKRVELFERECKVLRSIRHAAIPKYLDQFEHDGAFYLVMERVLGESLQERRMRGVHMTEGEVWRVLHEVGAILDELHAMQPPVIHRDVKPHNLVRRPDGTIALVDFGAVRDMLAARGGSTVAGTFGYMAPEQLHGRAFPQTDVYGLGATVIALMTGREPEDLAHKGLRIDVVSEVRASPALIAVLQRMLEPDPDLRPATVREAMGPHAPRPEKAAAPASASRETAARESPRDVPGPLSPESEGPSGAIESFALTLPAPLALLFTLLVFLVGLPFAVLGSLIFPILAALLPGSMSGVARGAGDWARGVHRAISKASGRAGRAALQGASRRREERLRVGVEARVRAKEERARLREESRVHRQQMKAEQRAWRERMKAGKRRR